jgi:Arc/MetJ-type ribon-helix-helix transcriptional regulator
MIKISLNMSDQLVSILDTLVERGYFKTRTEAMTVLICSGLTTLGRLIAENELEQSDVECQSSSQ